MGGGFGYLAQSPARLPWAASRVAGWGEPGRWGLVGLWSNALSFQHMALARSSARRAVKPDPVWSIGWPCHALKCWVPNIGKHRVMFICQFFFIDIGTLYFRRRWSRINRAVYIVTMPTVRVYPTWSPDSGHLGSARAWRTLVGPDGDGGSK